MVLSRLSILLISVSIFFSVIFEACGVKGPPLPPISVMPVDSPMPIATSTSGALPSVSGPGAPGVTGVHP